MATSPTASSDVRSSEEASVVRSLQRLAKRWPRSLTLVSMGGTLSLIHTRDRRFDADGMERQEAILADIDGIPNTGGDW